MKYFIKANTKSYAIGVLCHIMIKIARDYELIKFYNSIGNYIFVHKLCLRTNMNKEIYYSVYIYPSCWLS